MVVGNIRQSRWTAKDGTPRQQIQVMADRVQFLDWKDAAPVTVSGDGHPVEEAPEGEVEGGDD
jgi:single-stranded DNA-binding protein